MDYVVTGVFVALFAGAAARVLYLHWRGLRTTGTIVASVRDEASAGPVSSLVVRFTTATGVLIEAQSAFGAESVNSYHRIGKQVAASFTGSFSRTEAGG